MSLLNRGLTLVTGFSEDEGGGNGCGKSSCTSKGILWVLYGRTPSGLKADAVINRHAPDDVEVFGEVSWISGTDTYRVRRGRKPRGLWLYVNGEDVTRKVEKETQAEIDKAIGLSFEEFCGTRVFGQGLGAGVLAGTAGDQKSLLERLLPFDKVNETLDRFKIINDKIVLEKDDLFIQDRQLSTRIATLLKQMNEQHDIQTQYNVEQGLVNIPDLEDATNDVTDKREIVNRWADYLSSLEKILNGEPLDGVCRTCSQPLPGPTESQKEHFTTVKQRYLEGKAKYANAFELLQESIEMKRKAELKTHMTTVFLKNREALETQYHDAQKMSGHVKGQMRALDAEHSTIQKWQTIIKTQVRLALLEYACPVLSTITNRNLQDLRNGQISLKAYVERNGARDELAISVQSKSGGEGFDTLSGGEQQMTAFAFGLAMAELAVRTRGVLPDIMILDEPFSMLDERNSEAIVDYLTQKAPANTVLLVSNEETLKPLIPNVVKVIKSNGITTIQ